MMDGYSEEEQKDYDLLDWNFPADDLENSDESENEGKANGDLVDGGSLNANWEEW